MWALAVLFFIVAITLAILSVIYCEKKFTKIGCAALSLVLCFAISGASLFYLYGTASGERAKRSFQSNISGGIERTIKVYDVEGGLVSEYDGTFDISSESDYKIKFADENGKIHIIYFPTGTILIDEK